MPDDLRIEVGAAAEFGVRLDQYIGLWAVDDIRFMQMLQAVKSMDLRSHMTANRGRDVGQVKATEIVEATSGQAIRIGIVDIEGALTKRGSSFSDAGSMTRLRQTIRNMAADADIGGIMLRIDSPGGTVAGTADLAAEIAAAAAVKPVHAYLEDCTASAAYWLASQCNRIVANNRTAMVGSIGTFVGLYDLSGKAEQEGIKAVVIKSGEHKGAGFPGTPITEEQIAVWQGLIDKTQAEFTAAIANGRGMETSQVAALADGRSHMAEDAQALGLIDGIESFDAAMAALSQAAMGPQAPKGKTMSATTTATEKPAATLKEIKAACPKADSAFVLDQLERGATLDDVRSAWADELQSRLEAKDKELAAAKKTRKVAGVSPLTSRKRKAEDMPPEDDEEDDDTVAEGEEDEPVEEDEEDAPAAFWQAVARNEKRGMSRAKAVSAAVRENPKRHSAMIAASNRGRGRRRR